MNKFYTFSNITILVLLIYTINFIKQDMKLESYKTKRALIVLDNKLSNIQDKMLDNKIDVTVDTKDIDKKLKHLINELADIENELLNLKIKLNNKKNLRVNPPKYRKINL